MYPVEVIESRVWKNSKTGAKASIYGAVPWVFEPQPPEWEVVVQGYTLAMSNGTVGYGRPPLATREEAQKVMDDWLARIGRKPAKPTSENIAAAFSAFCGKVVVFDQKKQAALQPSA